MKEIKAKVDVMYVGVDIKDFGGREKKYIKCIQGDSIITISIPESLEVDVLVLEGGDLITLNVIFKSFWDREKKREINYIVLDSI